MPVNQRIPDTSCSVIIPSYNGKPFLRRTLDALRGSAVQPWQIIVVDDGSSDGTGEMLGREFPEVTCIRNRENVGPTASRNRGASSAEGSYLLFLDNDVLVHRYAVGNLLQFLNAHPGAGIVGGKLLTERGERMWWNMGYRFNNLREGIGYLIGWFIRNYFPRSRTLKNFSMHFSLNYWDYDRSIAVGWVIEAFFAIPRAVFQRVGGFDEGFFMFFEGPDLSERLRVIEHPTYFCHTATATVLEGHVHPNAMRAQFWLDGKRRYYQKHFYPLRSNPFFFWTSIAIRGFFYRAPGAYTWGIRQLFRWSSSTDAWRARRRR